MSRQRKSTFDPVVFIAVGVGLVTFSVILLALQNQGSQNLAIGTGSGFWGRLSVAFLTGLTTGGLSCLAVQGGLLASSLSRQIEQDMLAKPHGKKHAAPARTNTALPILLFLVAKLVAYTLLGVLLGWLGAFLTLSPMTRAVLMMLIGLFMIGNALRMFNVHPIFRYFNVEPPKFITRYIRRTAKGTETFTPIFLGLLTVFIPCGVTQAMMAAALATGSPLTGGAMMLAFTLGTSPVFFIVAYLTTELGARTEKFFMRFVAVTVLILGLVTFDGGLNLIGSPLSLQNLSRGLFPSESSVPSQAASESAVGNQPADDSTIVLNVENDGYFPQTLKASANTPVKLNLVTDKTYSCARDFVIPALNYNKLLPESGTVTVDIPAQPAGTKMFFTCSMGMYTGVIVFE